MGTRAELPIRASAGDILEAVRLNPVTVVIGETGSGKTTQLSQILDRAGYTKNGKIGITQPRRVAAVTVARRVAEEMRCRLGQEVGYAIRFEDNTSPKTRITYLTDGTLLRQLLDDDELSQYSVIILDEAHERSLNTDILFGLLKHLAKARKRELKVLITSATLNGEKFSAYFDDCPVLRVSGRVHDVQIIHSLKSYDTGVMDAAVETALEIHLNEPEGDILVFLTGQAEIEQAVAKLKGAINGMDPETCGDAIVLPLYAALPPDQQVQVFAKMPRECRRIVVATNIAETSVTVDGVVYVVDGGLVKLKAYNPQTGIESLRVGPISRVQGVQRAGRAGRTRPGKCYRLYTSETFESMAEATTPEIQRSSLLTAILYLKSLMLQIDVLKFDFLDPPSSAGIEDALRQLFVLSCITEDGSVTALGRRLAKLPLEPSLGKLLVAAEELGCLADACSLCAMLSADSIFVRNRGPTQLVSTDADGQSKWAGQISGRGRKRLKGFMAHGDGDHLLYLRLYKGWEASDYSPTWAEETGLDKRGLKFAKDIRLQLLGIMEGKTEGARSRSHDAKGGEAATERLKQAILAGYANKLAVRMPRHNGYRTLGQQPSLAQLHPSSAPLQDDDDGLLPEWIVYHELVQTAHLFLSKVCPVRGEWTQSIQEKLRSNVRASTLSHADGPAQPADDARHESAVPAVQQNDLRKQGLEDKAAAAKERFQSRKRARMQA